MTFSRSAMKKHPLTALIMILGLFALAECCLKPYKIKPGDTCWNIAQTNKLDLIELLIRNHLADCNNLQIGQVICLSKETSYGSASCHQYYSVVSGDTCWAISQRFGISLDQFTSYNPGITCSNLQIGQQVCVAQGDTPQPPTPGAPITFDQFSKAIQACGFPAPSQSAYAPFISRASSDGAITSNRELAMFLAQILHESGGLIYKREIRCLTDGCPNDYRSPGDPPGVFYFGRGYIQLTWSYNYKSASYALFGDDRLVTNPDLVAQTDDYSWAVSFWFWKTNVHSKVQDGHFGAATMAINGGLECNPCRNSCPTRFSYYSKILPIFGVDETPNPSGC